jgi:hypothetical protein
MTLFRQQIISARNDALPPGPGVGKIGSKERELPVSSFRAQATCKSSQ